MQRLVILTAIFLLTISASNCNEKKKEAGKIYKGKLEIRAICMNYTISLLEGTMDTSMIVSRWTDETTNKTYNNVFTLADPCKFPATIKEGDEFYFVIDTVVSEPCIVCMAYYPTPPKKLPIKVIQK